MPDMLSASSLSPKVSSLTAEALSLFQRGDLDSGSSRLSKAYALHRKTSATRTPLIHVVAYLGLLNDLPEKPDGDWKSASRLVMRHTGVSGVLEEWAFERSRVGKSVSANFHAACRRFCEDVPLSEEVRGEQDQIGLVAAILQEHGVRLETPGDAMSAIEKCLSAVSEITPSPSRPAASSQTPLPSHGSAGPGRDASSPMR
jgi:hypothetical protein